MARHSTRLIILRILHGVVTIYFILCLLYLYIVGLTGNVSEHLFTLAILSLAMEGIAVFALNQGNCPLIHLQRKIGDDKPFFELFMTPKLAKRAIPVFAWFTLIALLIILLRLTMQ